MASGDVVFETTGDKQDSFSAVDTYDSASAKNGVDVEFSFASQGTYGTNAVLNGVTLSVKDITFKLHQDLPQNATPPVVKVESDSPFESGKNYKIQIVEV